jgi:hypothetical protein
VQDAVAGVVVAFAFTQTDISLRLSLAAVTAGLYRSHLGDATFAELNRELPFGGAAFLGANNWNYTELAYWGNPGFYNHYALSATFLGSAESAPIDMLGDVQWGLYDEQLPSVESKEHELEAFRRVATPDTIAVFSPSFDPYAYSGEDVSGAVGYYGLREYAYKKQLAQPPFWRYALDRWRRSSRNTL